MRRREFLLGLTAVVGATRPARAAPRVALAAAWQAGTDSQVGVLQQDSAGTLRIVRALDVPTRAHGLLREAGGTLLAVARRPGDWLLRWERSGRAVAWRWIEPRRAFSGHVIASADGRTLYTTETELDTGAGLVGVRDSASLESARNGTRTASTHTSSFWTPPEERDFSSPTGAYRPTRKQGASSTTLRAWTPHWCNSMQARVNSLNSGAPTIVV